MEAKKVVIKKSDEKLSDSSLLAGLKDINKEAIKDRKKGSKRNIYKYPDGMNKKDKKIFRQDRRKDNVNFVEMLDNCTTETEIKAVAIKFLVYYKQYFLITDFTIDTFTNVSSEHEKDHYQNLSILLDVMKRTKVKFTL